MVDEGETVKMERDRQTQHMFWSKGGRTCRWTDVGGEERKEASVTLNLFP